MTTSRLSRLWIYQGERFPLAKTVPLLAVFSAASVTVSATLAGRALPGIGAYLIGFALVFLIFFQMRVCDEIKDQGDDRRFRPERPIPRGLISLHEITLIGAATVPLAAGLALLWGQGLIWLLGLVWLWLALMTAEFGAPAWLKARPVLYLLSHMAIMPLIDLMLTGIEWLPHGAPPAGLGWFIGLSFANGCVLELGRKLWAPASEREGVETYSKLWGPARAGWIWLGLVALSCLLLIGIGTELGHAMAFAVIGLAGLGACGWALAGYLHKADVKVEKRLDTMAGLWVLICYLVAGFAPLLIGALS